MNSRIRFVELSLLLVILNVMDMFTTIVAVRFSSLYEFNWLIANYLLDKPLVFLMIKVFVPLLVVFYLYCSVGLKTYRTSFRGFTLSISSFKALSFCSVIYTLIVLNNTFLIVREVLKL